MRENLDHLKKYSVLHPIFKVHGEGLCGFFTLRRYNKCTTIQRVMGKQKPPTVLRIQSSDGEGWDHVSVSCKFRCPTWADMDFVKNLFFKENETVIQFHPKKSEYVNNAVFCLHLWRRHDEEYELPPSILTGIK